MKKIFAFAIFIVGVLGIISCLVILKYDPFSMIRPVPSSISSAEVALVKPDEKFCNDIVHKTHRENFNDGLNPEEFTTPSVCTLDIGKNTSYLFSFESTSTEVGTDFFLNIYTPDHTFLQTLPFDYSWQYDVHTINLHDDINFDGYNDLLLRVASPRAAQFTYYIYNPKTKIFEADDKLSNIFSPTFDTKKRTITATPEIPNYYIDDNGEQQYYTPEEQTTVFRFRNGKYVISR